MEFKTKTGTCYLQLGLYSRKKGDKTKFNRFLYDSGFTGDLTNAWKDYQDASKKK